MHAAPLTPRRGLFAMIRSRRLASPLPLPSLRPRSAMTSSNALVVLSMDHTQAAGLRHTLEQLGLKHVSTVLSASDEDDHHYLLSMLDRRPITCEPRADEDGEWVESPAPDEPIVCLLIAHYSLSTSILLFQVHDRIVRWINRGGIVLVHGPGASTLLGAFGKQGRWACPPAGGKCSLNADQQVQMERRGMFPSAAALPKELCEVDGKDDVSVRCRAR